MSGIRKAVITTAILLPGLAVLGWLRERAERHAQDLKERETERLLAHRERTALLILTAVATFVLLAAAVAFLAFTPDHAEPWARGAGAGVALALGGFCVRVIGRLAGARASSDAKPAGTLR